jgi:hypothetical protein
VARGRPLTIPITFFNDTLRPIFVAAPERVQAYVDWNSGSSIGFPRFDLPLFVEASQQLPLLLTTEVPVDVAAADTARLRVRVTGSVHLDEQQPFVSQTC